MMAERVPIDTYCEKKIPTLQKTYDGLIDYVDISSVDNTEKKIISYQTIESNGAPSRAKQLLKKGDVLVSTVRPNLNAVAVVEEETENLMVGSTGYCVLRCKDNMDVRYLFNFCQSQYFVDDMSSQATGASYPAVSNGIVRSALIPCYSIEEQRGIAEKMDTVSELLALRKQQLAELDELIKSRFIELFGDCLTNPKGWKTKHLEDIAEVGSSKRVFVEDLKETGIPFYRGTEVGALAEGKPIKPELFITEEHYSELCEATGTPRIGDLLMPSICPDGRIWVVNSDEPFYFKDGRVLWVHNIDASYNSIFLLYTLKDRIMTDYSSIASGTTFAELKIFALKKCRIFDVPLAMQNEFATFIKQTDKSKLAVQQSIAELEELKKSLMQKYFG